MSNKTIKNLLTMAVLATATTGAWGASSIDTKTVAITSGSGATSVGEAVSDSLLLSFPDELLLEILKGLAQYPHTFVRISRTCKRLHNLCHDKEVWPIFLLHKFDDLKFYFERQVKDFIFNSSPEKLLRKYMFRGEEFMLQKIVESYEFLFLNTHSPNMFYEIPETLRYFVNLKVLDLSGNHLDTYYGIRSLAMLRTLPKLEKLNLTFCHLSRIPEVFGEIKTLKELSLSFSCFGTDAGLESFATLSTLSKLEKLDLTSCGLRRIPAVLGALENLKVLNLCNNPNLQIDDIDAFRSLRPDVKLIFE